MTSPDRPTTPDSSASRPAAPAAAPAGGSFTGPPAGSPERRSRHIGWRSRDVLRAACLVLLVYVAARLVWFAYPLIFVAFLGILFGLAVTSGVDRIVKLKVGRFHLPRGLAAALIVFGFLGALGAGGAWMAPTIREQSKELRTKLPEAIDKIEAWAAQRQGGVLGSVLGLGQEVSTATGGVARAANRAGTAQPAAGPRAAPAAAQQNAQPAAGPRAAPAAAQQNAQQSAQPDAAAAQPGAASAQPGAASARPASAGATAAEVHPLRDRLKEQMGGVAGFLRPFLSSTFAVLSGILIIIFLAIYVAADPETYHQGLMHLFPHRARSRAGEVLSTIALTLRKWLQTQLIAMIVIGAVSTGVYLALGLKAAIPLGILAGLFEFIPTVGPILSAIPAIAMGFVDSPSKALTVAIACIVIQFLENQLLIPQLMKKSVDIPPVLTILGQALMALVFGFPGLLVAVPVLAATMVAVKMLYVEDVVGDDVLVLDGGDDDDD